MVGLDLDGTLLNSEKKLTEYTKRIIQKALEQGCVVLVSTGRPITAVPKEVISIPGMQYAVTTNGAQVLDLKSGKALFTNLIPIDVSKKVLEIFADYDALYEIFVDGRGYAKAECMERLSHYFEKPSSREYMRTTRTPVESVEETLAKFDESLEKIHAIFHDMNERKEAIGRLLQIPEIVVASSAPTDVEINRKGTDKGMGLLRLGEMLGIQREEIMACGDEMNDYKMLQTVGFAVAMGNGVSEIKEIADYITDTNDNDGVAKAIEKFVLK